MRQHGACLRCGFCLGVFMVSFYDRIEANKRNSYVLVFFVFLLVFAMVYVFSWMFFGDDLFGFFLGAIASIIYIGITYFFAGKIVLSMSGAREASKDEYPYLFNTVENISIAAGIPAPKPYIIDDPAMNAFAVGNSPDKACVAFTTGLVKSLNRAELEGVVAHEISHIKNYDSKMATLAVVMVGLIAILSDLGLRSMFWGRRGGGGGRGRGGGIMMLIGLAMMILAPIAAHLVRLALSREREYLADATAAQLTRYPEGLASALSKLSSHSAVQRSSDATAPLYIANPLTVNGLFSTHPPIIERIKRLRAM